MRPVTSSGEVRAIALSATLAPRRMTTHAVADGEYIGHAMADENHGDALILQAADEVEDLGDLAHADRGRRLVHEHDLGVREAGSRDRHRLALAARHLFHEIARARLGLEFLEELRRASIHRRVIQDAEEAEAPLHLASEEHIGGRGEIVAEREILINDLDSLPLSRPRAYGNA